MMLSELIQKLKLVNANRGSGYVRAFESVLAEIAAESRPDVIAELIPFFEDDAPSEEVMFSIIHTLERFDDSTYVTGVLAVLLEFWDSAPRWTLIVFMRMLNSEPTRLELIRQVQMASPNIKRVVSAVVEQINAHKVEFIPKTMALISAPLPLSEG
jgi:hypothetical protein